MVTRKRGLTRMERISLGVRVRSVVATQLVFGMGCLGLHQVSG